MTWTPSISYKVAQSIFEGVDFDRIFDDGGNVVLYTATFQGKALTNRSITTLCNRLWAMTANLVEAE